jgi:hypothetical protein
VGLRQARQREAEEENLRQLGQIDETEIVGAPLGYSSASELQQEGDLCPVLPGLAKPNFVGIFVGTRKTCVCTLGSSRDAGGPPVSQRVPD